VGDGRRSGRARQHDTRHVGRARRQALDPVGRRRRRRLRVPRLRPPRLAGAQARRWRRKTEVLHEAIDVESFCDARSPAQNRRVEESAARSGVALSLFLGGLTAERTEKKTEEESTARDEEDPEKKTEEE